MSRASSTRRVYISELARILDRRPNTLRGWERGRDPRLPRHLRSRRDGNGAGWRYWTPEQVEGIKEWMVKQRMFPGAGLPNFDSSPEQVGELLSTLRRRTAA